LKKQSQFEEKPKEKLKEKLKAKEEPDFALWRSSL